MHKGRFSSAIWQESALIQAATLMKLSIFKVHAMVHPRVMLTVMLVFTLCTGGPSMLQAAGPSAALSSEDRSGNFNGQLVGYRAAYRSQVISSESGEPVARLYAMDYQSSTAPSPMRPVVFIWNGGPSVAATTLHMAGFGPRRMALSELGDPGSCDPVRLIDNPDTLLDWADLVFLDPVETGWSRLLDESQRAWLYSAEGDAWATERFIRQWLETHGRSKAPIYLMGTSYGSIRAAIVSRRLAEAGMPPQGVILFSQGVNLIETTQRRLNAIGYASNISQMAVIARFHQRGAYLEHPPEAVLQLAEDFAMDTYLQALVQGHDLAPERFAAVSRQLADLLGLPVARVREQHLLVNKRQFRQWLLEEEGLVLAANDGRHISPATDPGPADPAIACVPEAWQIHFQELFGSRLDLDLYRLRAPDTEQWDWGGSSTRSGRRAELGDPRSVFADYDWTGDLAAVATAEPNFRIFVAIGRYDTLTTYGPARLLVTSPILPADRTALHHYPGGHSFYAHPEVFQALSSDLRAFLLPEEEP